MTAINRAILVILLCLPALTQAAAELPAPAGGPYIVFIHCGPKKATDPAIKALALALTKSGYSVREPEEDQDKVGGPGVDYFSPDAKNEADKIATFVGTQLSLNPPLKSRLQNLKESLYQKFYVGIWLY
jgi:hypothetical protein